MAYGSDGGNPGKDRHEAEANEVRSALAVAKVVAVGFGAVLLLWALGTALTTFGAGTTCHGVQGSGRCAVNVALAAIPTLLLAVFGAVDVVIYLQARKVETLVSHRWFVHAQRQTLTWTIVGLFVGGIAPGLVLLLAYLKLRPLVRWERFGATGGAAVRFESSSPGLGGVPTPPLYGAPATEGNPVPGTVCSACGRTSPAGAHSCSSCGNPLTPSG